MELIAVRKIGNAWNKEKKEEKVSSNLHVVKEDVIEPSIPKWLEKHFDNQRTEKWGHL